jgi:hypothetical protein
MRLKRIERDAGRVDQQLLFLRKKWIPKPAICKQAPAIRAVWR